MSRSKTKTICYLLTYAISVSSSVYLAAISEKNWRPLPFSEFYLSGQETLNIALVLGPVCFLAIAIGRLLSKPLESKRKFSIDYLNFMLGYTVSILYFLLASSITFSPNLFVYIGIYSSVFAVLVHLFYLDSPNGLFKEVGDCIADLFKRFISIYGLFILIFFMIPIALAMGFIFSRDVADVITKVRLEFNKATKLEWHLVPIFDNVYFRRPMIVRFGRKSQNTLYLLERSGKLYKLDYPSGKNKKLILDITNKVGLVDLENGALGFALHPKFDIKSSEHYKAMFAYYTSVHDGKQTNVVSKFTLKNEINPTERSETYLLRLDRIPNGFHNGGSLEFGPDGFLYIALGEGIFLGKTKHVSKTLRAGILRIDVDQQGGEISSPVTGKPIHGITSNYYIPNDNPFVENDNVMDEYWALGLRNPFRISFDYLSGALWAGDVGSEIWEEVNKIEKGNNYLYPYIEGPKTDEFAFPSNIEGQPTHPVFAYKHSAFDRAVIGGVVYHGKELPGLVGTYIYGDNFSGKLFGIKTDREVIPESQLIAQADQYAQRGISSITYSPKNEVFVTLLGAKGRDTGQLMILKKMDNDTHGKKLKKEIIEVTDEHSYDDVESLFLENCSRCHGRLGRGDGPDSAAFNIKIADFTSKKFQEKKLDAEIFRIITKGGAANNLSSHMPPWEHVLSESEIGNLVTFIRALEFGKK